MKIEIIPFGDIESWMLITTSNILEEVYDLETIIRDSEKLPKNIYNKDRKQYNSSKLLKHIKNIKKEDYVIGITKEDIYTNSLNFIFGQAEFGCCAVLSINRLKSKNENRYIERIEKEVLHECGHALFKLGHCSNEKCVMAFSKSIIDVDLKGKDLCSNCKSLIEKYKD